ncbi:hypothetical protein BO79DRAFT_215228 [Aspergillus costaricaensis CBS 115574]|uniref:Uncharacterized protein n=1 Tax=Aspergillus costaricaensis CBS 115574 TaxID=1448317 RepID=A0ACD1IMB4_9EURO|nr:hypothetical protein BO79DRAFT_215228 [Aspergillus costaricaensis CBS 115574]RAK91541.1 hypothetical protein BO79DRAFT_215228 [Aspergillus costaricaensis CBS 115574]
MTTTSSWNQFTVHEQHNEQIYCLIFNYKDRQRLLPDMPPLRSGWVTRNAYRGCPRDMREETKECMRLAEGQFSKSTSHPLRCIFSLNCATSKQIVQGEQNSKMFSKLFIAVTTLMPILAMAAPQVDTTIHASLWSEPDRGGPQQNILDTNCHDLDLNHVPQCGGPVLCTFGLYVADFEANPPPGCSAEVATTAASIICS